MRRVRVDHFVRDASRLGGVVVQVPVLDVSGIDLHEAGDPLGALEIRSLREVPLDEILALDPREDRQAARLAQGAEELPLEALEPTFVLAQNVYRRNGQRLLRAGSFWDPASAGALRAEGIPALAIRRDAEDPAVRRARSYLDRCTPPPPRPNRLDPARGEQAAWPPFAPRARVLVALKDDMSRLRVMNQVLAAGHEAAELGGQSGFAEEVRQKRFDVVFIDAEASAEACAAVRASEFTRTAGVVACLAGARGPAERRARFEGINEVLTIPAGLERIAHALWRCQWLQGRRLGVPSAILHERRSLPRHRAVSACELRDPVHAKASPVTHATLLDVSLLGVRIEYGLLEMARLDQYLCEGVHARHPLFPYAQGNPAGRDLILRMARPGTEGHEVAARVAHVWPSLRSDVVGLVFTEGPQAEIVQFFAPPAAGLVP